ncbi:MAG TPA: OB-fold nucleic acid binding domain-containing protein, partial [Chitinophagaceae bacterium]|nr:OB-fold nucleic acid binding domain-containing protein [Chitinophagaceae bacterium]
NESLKGFAVNNKGEIRFGLGGLKGVGDAAVESIIEDRKKNGAFKTVFDLIKRINQRTVNKKTLESLAYAGGFDCFTEHHRAQYFYTPPEDTTSGLERIIRYGQIIQTQNATATNTLFGDLPISMEIPPPRLLECMAWPLIVQLDHEKDVTGMFLSGHPLDHYRFEMKHYGVTNIADFNEFKDAIRMQTNPGRMFRLIGLVADAQHKISRQGNKYGNFVIEDYSGKTELILFSEDYLKFTPFLQNTHTVFITGFFKPRYNREEFEFKVLSISLVETIKRNLTKQVTIEVNPKDINEDMIRFMEKNIKSFPGKSSLKFTLTEPRNKTKISLITMDNGFEMNDELVHFLEAKPELEVQVLTV